MPVDLSPYLRFIRCQGGDGCWGHATCAIWDILNELHCPYSPTMSMSIWLMLHRRRDLWKDIATPDGRHFDLSGLDGPEWGAPSFFQVFGNPGEGTAPTMPGNAWTLSALDRDAVDEAVNYRLKGPPSEIPITSARFERELAAGHPIRLEVGAGHVIAVVGYDEAAGTFTYVNSYGDRWGAGGFGTLSYAEVDANNSADWGSLDNAFTLEVVPPRPLPVVEIQLRHLISRQHVELWLSVEDSPRPKRRIWPAFFFEGDDSAGLHFTVRAPRELVWPPQPGRRLRLDLLDTSGEGMGGGEVIALRAAFTDQSLVNCAATLGSQTVAFCGGQHLPLTIP